MLGRGGVVKRNWVAAAEDTDPEIQGKLGSGMQSCELPVKPSKSQKSSLRKTCQGKKNKGLLEDQTARSVDVDWLS